MSATKNTTKNDARSVTVKKANTKKAAMKNVGQEIAEFGVKNREAGSKARGIKKNGLATPAANTGVKTPSAKGRLSESASSATNPRGAKKKLSDDHAGEVVNDVGACLACSDFNFLVKNFSKANGHVADLQVVFRSGLAPDDTSIHRGIGQ